MISIAIVYETVFRSKSRFGFLPFSSNYGVECRIWECEAQAGPKSFDWFELQGPVVSEMMRDLVAD